MIWTVLATLCTVTTAFVAFWDSFARSRRGRLIVLVCAVAASFTAIFAAVSAGAEHAELVSLQTGGDAFCHLVPSFPGGDKNRLELNLMKEGETPLYDVRITIRDATDWPTLDWAAMTTEQRDKHFLGETRSLGNFGVGSRGVVGLGGRSLGGLQRATFYVDFSARNGFWSQTIEIEKKNGQWRVYSKVVRGETVLYKRPD